VSHQAVTVTKDYIGEIAPYFFDNAGKTDLLTEIITEKLIFDTEFDTFEMDFVQDYCLFGISYLYCCNKEKKFTLKS
jgi:hypothetical protein